MFYTYHQNNSGGYYIKNENVDVFVVVEGNSHDDIQRKANKIFRNHSEYCSCCGERWQTDISWDDLDDLDDKSMIYGESVYKVKNNSYKGNKVIIYYKNGKRETVVIQEEEVKKELEKERLRRGKDRLHMDIADNRVYFVYGEEKYLMPEDISFRSDRDYAHATKNGVIATSFITERYIIFNKGNIESNRLNVKLGSKDIYEKCIQFKTLADMLLKRKDMLDKEIQEFCKINNIEIEQPEMSLNECIFKIEFKEGN